MGCKLITAMNLVLADKDGSATTAADNLSLALDATWESDYALYYSTVSVRNAKTEQAAEKFCNLLLGRSAAFEACYALRRGDVALSHVLLERTRITRWSTLASAGMV